MNIAVLPATLQRDGVHISAKLFDYPFNRPFSRLNEMNYLQRLRRAKWNRKARILKKANEKIELNEVFKAPPPKQLAQRLKDKIKPVIVGHNNFHVKAYYHHLSWTNSSAKSPEDISRLSVSDIQHIVAGNAWELDGVKVEPFEITVKQIKGHRRRREISLVRQVSMFVARNKTDLSFPSIGRFYGGRDHTTVIHAHQKMLKAVALGKLLMNGKPFKLDRIGEI